MTDDQQILPAPGPVPDDAQARRENDRRDFFRSAFGAAGVAALGAAAVAVGPRAFAQSVTDGDTLNLFLNLKYLQAQFYAYAATGNGLTADQLTGSGTAGSATGGRQATFTDPLVAQYAAELAAEKARHVAYLRTTLSTYVVAQPAIDVAGTAGSAFSTLMGAAGVVTKGTAFDPYASDSNFLLAAFFLEDVVAAVVRGQAANIVDKTNLENLMGMLGTDSYHASMIRTTLYAKGATTASLRTNADAISNVRDALDGPTTDDDQGISPATVNSNLVSNIVPAAADGTVFPRDTGSTLNIFYLNSAQVAKGGFFPNGVNGAIVSSSAN